MSGRRILILYGTSYGQTAKIAARMADHLAASGDLVTLVDANKLPRRLTPDQFDAVIVGGSIMYGHHPRRVLRFVRAYADTLSAMPSAFFSVSGAAASPNAEEQARARQYVDEFLHQTGWRPRLNETIAGAMAYTKYNPLLRWMTKRVSAKEGGPTDTSRDHELTDWAQVERFTEAFAVMIPRPADVRVPAGA